MAVSARKLIYDTVRKVNGFNTGAGKHNSVLDVVSAVNDAYEIIVENNIRLADTSSIIRDNLRKLEVKNKELEFEKMGDFYLAKYPDNLYKRLNHVVEVSCESCDKQKKIIPRVVQSDDLHEARRNPFRRSNFFWEQLVMDEGSGGLYLYTDSVMDIHKVTIDYYRKINYIEAPTLVECNDYSYSNYDDKLITNDVNFDLDNTYVARKVSDVAALILSRDNKDTETYKLKLDSLIQLDKIT